MRPERPKRVQRIQAWLLLLVAVITWVIHKSMPTMGAGLGPVSGSTVAAIIALGSTLYLYMHRDKGGS